MRNCTSSVTVHKRFNKYTYTQYQYFICELLYIRTKNYWTYILMSSISRRTILHIKSRAGGDCTTSPSPCPPSRRSSFFLLFVCNFSSTSLLLSILWLTFQCLLYITKTADALLWSREGGGEIRGRKRRGWVGEREEQSRGKERAKEGRCVGEGGRRRGG